MTRRWFLATVALLTGCEFKAKIESKPTNVMPMEQGKVGQVLERDIDDPTRLRWVDQPTFKESDSWL